MTPILRRIAAASAVAAALMTSACVTNPDPYPAAAVSGDVGRWVPIEAGRARVALAAPASPDVPASPGALAAREFRTSQGELVQTLTLPNNTAVPGDNELVAAFDYGPSSIFQADVHAAKVGRYAMEPASLNRLIGEMLPRAVLQGEPQIRKNGYGLYGYVSADYPGQAKCVLAWQVLDGTDLRQAGGAAPRRTYRSASPVPPDSANWRLDAPVGTFSVKLRVLLAAPDRPDTGTPFCSTLPPPLEAVKAAVSDTPENAEYPRSMTW